jgi:hypothetical protein
LGRILWTQDRRADVRCIRVWTGSRSGRAIGQLLTPDESRELNAECIVFDYFDSHDIWHVLSAAAVFVLAVLIWSLDRGIEHIPRSQLHVF